MPSGQDLRVFFGSKFTLRLRVFIAGVLCLVGALGAAIAIVFLRSPIFPTTWAWEKQTAVFGGASGCRGRGRCRTEANPRPGNEAAFSQGSGSPLYCGAYRSRFGDRSRA